MLRYDSISIFLLRYDSVSIFLLRYDFVSVIITTIVKIKILLKIGKGSMGRKSGDRKILQNL